MTHPEFDRDLRVFLDIPETRQALMLVRMGDHGETLQRLVRQAFAAGGASACDLISEMIGQPEPGADAEVQSSGSMGVTR